MPTKLPSRADHVGSFLRPRSVIEAREHRSAGNIDYSELRAIEDKAIADLVKWQESLGLKAITDWEIGSRLCLPVSTTALAPYTSKVRR